MANLSVVITPGAPVLRTITPGAPVPRTSNTGRHERGFTLVELLVSMAITTVILASTMAAMNDAIKATDGAMLLVNMNNALRTSMDLIVRDMLQVGQGLPAGRVIMIPSGVGALGIRLPGPPGTNLTLPGAAGLAATSFSAVVPGPGLGPAVNPGPNVPTDIITTLQADSAFEGMDITALNAAAGGSGSMVVSNVPPPAGQTGGGTNISNNGPDDIRPGDLIMLTKASVSALVHVTRVTGQTVFFDTNDSLRLNQGTAAADGSLFEYRTSAPSDAAPIVPPNLETNATRVRMITFYIDTLTTPGRPRLVRRLNSGDPVAFNNNLGTAVAFDIENLQISYDLADGVTNPAGVKMTVADQNGTGRCAPNPCSRNNIRKVNIVLSGRSRVPTKGTRQFLRNRLQTQVSLRSLAFVDRYQ